jgi:hypothetical protein
VPDSGQNTEGNTGNLRPPWKPGESGNPGGRPKKKPLTDAYAAILGKPVPAEVAEKLKVDTSTTYAEIIAMALAREAVKGNVRAAGELADRVEGKIGAPGDSPENPLHLKVEDVRDELAAALSRRPNQTPAGS